MRRPAAVTATAAELPSRTPLPGTARLVVASADWSAPRLLHPARRRAPGSPTGHPSSGGTWLESGCRTTARPTRRSPGTPGRAGSGLRRRRGPVAHREPRRARAGLPATGHTSCLPDWSARWLPRRSRRRRARRQHLAAGLRPADPAAPDRTRARRASRSRSTEAGRAAPSPRTPGSSSSCPTGPCGCTCRCSTAPTGSASWPSPCPEWTTTTAGSPSGWPA